MTTEHPAELMEVFGKQYNAEILAATPEPKSAEELSEELGIPIATCYRSLDELVASGLLESERGHSYANRDIRMYQRAVDGIVYDFHDSLTITEEGAYGIKRKLLQAVQSLRPNM